MSGSQQHHQQSPNFYRSSYSPTDQHHPHYQSSAHPNQTAYRPVANGAVPPPPPPPPTAQQAHYASAAPGRSYYDPVDRTEISSGGWGYLGRERTSSVHSQHSNRDHRVSYGPGPDSTAQSPPELHTPAFGYPPPVPNLNRRSSSVHGDLRVGETSPMHAEFRPTTSTYAAPGEPTSPNHPQQARRPGAMSISALLSNAEEAPVEGSPQHTRVSPTIKRTAPPDKSIQRSMDLNRLNVQQTAPRQVVTSEQAAWDADVTDSDTELGVAPNGRSGKQSNHAFKYHELIKLQQQQNQLDTDRSDSSVASDEFREERINYITRTRKRQMQIEQMEADNRKKRRLAYSDSLELQLCSAGNLGRKRAGQIMGREAKEQVLRKEEEEEKERKKEQQRKRRREKAMVEKKIREETARMGAADQPLYAAPKISERSATFEEGILDLNADAPDSDFSGVPNEEDAGKKIRKKPGPKKGTARPPPREVVDDPMDIVRPEVKEEYVPHASKTYNQVYDQIWKDIARKDIPRVYRIQQNSQTTKHANLRKTAQLASKEAQRWKLRTTKNVKDTQARAKRCMREMLTFWKRNEREERDLRRRAEKEAIDRAKKEEEQREAKRQARKLNFLISQTELYSHFIGRKIKTDEVEKSTGSDAIGGGGEIPQGGNLPTITTADGKPAAVTDFESLDFDDEEALQRAAASNAQHAIEAARERARAFNQPAPGEGNVDVSNLNLDEGEMNFQNPTSLGDIDIQQPKMLNCQLKEYQLKGLNWLCNLYEQGINGILADEMGLGKTVQSISVMAYLAEYHNIWGPFLVIAPASTLHNWQQEISRFVPTLKALPYWGTAKDRKVLRKFWDRKSLTYTKDSPFHVLITSYQLVVQDTQYFQRMKWQYMILDEAQAIKSSTSSRWKALLGFHCRNRLLLTGTPIQNSMQELWALLHFIMPSLFDSHDEFSEWFSKDIESHAQSNTQLNESQLRRLHMILKPFMLRRVKKHVQKELGDKIEIDVFCNLTYRQRAIYKGLRDKISIMDLIEKAASGGDDNAATLMNLVMQFRKVCNHPDLFERADVKSPFSLTAWGETSSFLREGNLVDVQYTARNLISYDVPALVYREGGRLELPGNDSAAGSRYHVLKNMFNIWTPDKIRASVKNDRHSGFSWLSFVGASPNECSTAFNKELMERFKLIADEKRNARRPILYDDEQPWTPLRKMLLVQEDDVRQELASCGEGHLAGLLNVSKKYFCDQTLDSLDPMVFRTVSAPPIGLNCLNMGAVIEQENFLFNPKLRQYIYGPGPTIDSYILDNKIEPNQYPGLRTLTEPSGQRTSYSSIQVPSMGRFVSDSGKLAKLDQLLTELKPQGHRVLLYFQMTRMMDLCEEYLTYRHYKYLRLDGSSKLEDRRDMVSAWQTNPEIYVFILSTRAGGLGINLTAADTVIFYDSDWNPTIDSQAMDRAHRLGQTKQVSVYRLITRGTIEERIRMRAQQKEEVQRVVIQGGGGDPGVKKNVDFKGTREVATWLFDDDDAEKLEKTLEAKEKEAEEQKLKKGANAKGKKRKVDGSAVDAASKSINIEDMYHEGEGRFDDSAKPSDTGTPAPSAAQHKKKPANKKGNKKKTTQERLNMIDGTMDVNMGGV